MEALIKKYLFLILLALSNVLVLNGQKTFQRVFDGKGIFEHMTHTSDEGYLIISNGPLIPPASSEGTKDYDAGLLKLDSNYEVQWLRYFASNGRSLDVFYDVVEFEDFYYALGLQDVHDNRKSVLVKLDQDGHEVWTKILSKDEYVEPKVLAVIDGELWVLIYQTQNGGGQSGYFLLDKDGEIIERKFFSTQKKNITFRGVNKYKNDYYLIGTTFNDEGIDQNFVLVKLTEDKEVLWMKEYESVSVDGTFYSRKTSITFIKDHLYIGGRGGERSENFRNILKLDLEGELVLANRYEGLDGLLVGADGLFITHQNKLYTSYGGIINGAHFPGLAMLDEELELVSHRLYQSENLSGTSTSFLTEDGFLILGNQRDHRDDYQGGSLIKTNFDLNSSCLQFENELIITDITHEYTAQDVSFIISVNGDLTLTTWDSTYTLETKVIYNCEETNFTLHDKAPQSYCKEDVVELTIYGKEGAISWNIAPELILEETDDKIRFIIKEEMIVEATDNSTGKHYSLPIAIDCSSGEYPDMRVNETISSNNDGFNDFFTIENVEFYPENQVLIVDQRGNKVFSEIGYENNWEEKQLAQGIYQYIIRRNLSDENPLKGILVVKY